MSRREIVNSASGDMAPTACVVRPQLTEGPHVVDEKLDRSDIAEGRVGVPLALAFNVSELNGSAGMDLPPRSSVD